MFGGVDSHFAGSRDALPSLTSIDEHLHRVRANLVSTAGGGEVPSHCVRLGQGSMSDCQEKLNFYTIFRCLAG